MAGSGGSGESAGWRVFISHTSELRNFPAGKSYVTEVERAISAAGHVIVDMADFPAAARPATQVCVDRVRSCQVYVGVLGTRYGSPVRDNPEVSYTELEFDTATEAGLDRLVFLLDTDAENVGIPLQALIDRDSGARQDAFRRRVQDSELTTQSFASPAELGRLVERSLRELADTRAHYAPQYLTTPARDLFISYVHEDEQWLHRIMQHLQPLVTAGTITIWSDENIKAGQFWHKELDQAIGRARVALLLVSPSYLRSNFVAEQEIPALIRAAEERRTRLTWILLSEATYQSTPVAKLQAAHNLDQPLDTLETHDQERALSEIADNIAEAF
jgi:hypothetical protein